MNKALSKLERKWSEGKFVCVGLDPDPDKLKGSQFGFNKKIIDQTADLVCAFKLQVSFYEAMGLKGWQALEKTIKYIRGSYPDIFVILDAKRADIESTNEGYAKAYFKNLNFDALTVHPYLGGRALQPFLDYQDKLIFVLVKTSNEGSSEFQDLKVSEKPLYQIVAYNVSKKWNRNSNCAVVVGATYPKELKAIRGIIGEIPMLIPGVGAQGGDLEESVKNGVNSKGEGILVNSSRGIIFAPSPREATLSLHNRILKAMGRQTRLSDSQKKLIDMFLKTRMKAKVLRRKSLGGRKYHFYDTIRQASPIDFPVNNEEFVIKVHQKKPDAPLSPFYINLRNLPTNLIKQIARVLSEVTVEKTDYCTGIPYTANAFAKEYSKITKIPYIDIYEKKGTPTNRKLVTLEKATKGTGKSLLIIDDIIVHGYSKMEAIKEAEKLGYKVSTLSLVDRNQGGSEELKKLGYGVYRSMDILPILEYCFQRGRINKKRFEEIKVYLNNG